MNEYVGGYGPINAKLMILSDCPSENDKISGKPFTKTGELDRVLSDSGINKHNCWLTTVSKYHIPEVKRIPFSVRAKNVGIDINQQLVELQSEINQIKPNCILALGSAALWALKGTTKIGQYRGSILHGMGSKFIPSYNPRDLSWQAISPEFIGHWNRAVMVFDFKRALHQSRFPELKLPQRVLEICKNSAHLAEFRNKYQSHRKMSVDIESDGTCMPVCIGLSFTKNHGMTVPLWNCNGISTIPDSDLVQIWLILSEMLWEKDIIGQNFNYDRDKLKRLGFIIRKLVSDTMMKAFAINPELPKGLAFNTSLYTEEPFYKNEGMYEGSITDLLIGCARDACVTIETDQNMNKDLVELGIVSYYNNFLMKLPDLYWEMENQGLGIDSIKREELIKKYIEWDERIRYDLYCIVGTEINVNSPTQIASLLWDNFGLPRKDSTGEDDITALLNSPKAFKHESQRRVCELILEGRRVRKSISTYLMALPDFDGKMRTTYFPCLDTGRTSTGQQDPPIRPTIEVIDENGKKKKKVLGIAFQTMTKHGDIGADIRGMYVPDSSHYEKNSNGQLVEIMEDEIFVQADSSQAEARVVWLLANDEEALRLVDEIDYHALTASWFFGGTEQDYSKKVLGYEHPIRFAGKTLRHAGHLGASKRRAAISVNTDARKYKIPIHIDEATAEHALKIFHSKQPRIQSVFQNGIIECLKQNRTLVAPLPYGIDAAMGGKRIFYEKMGDELYRQGFSYIPQRTVTDNTKAAALRIRDRIPLIKIIMESHDSLLFTIPISKMNKYIPIIKEEMERPINFSRCSIPRRDLIIPCEIETGYNYCDLKKFKDLPLIQPSVIKPKMIPRSPNEAFEVIDLLCGSESWRNFKREYE